LVVLGLVLAASALVRPIVLPFVVVLAVVWRRAGWRQSVSAAAVILGVALLAILPWSIRSTRAMNGVVAISTNTGDNLCTGHSTFSNGAYINLGDHCWSGYDSVAADHLEVDRDRTGSRQALDYAVHHPWREVTLLVRKTWQLVHHDHEGVLAADSYGEQPVLPSRVDTLARIIADVSWWVLVFLAAIGVRLLWRRGSEQGRIVMGLAGVLLAMPLVFFGNARFHVPAEPFLAIAASAALTSATISQSVRHQRSH
jgi:4-amino-4-deoxy-L-arabinose transferase-like glycosyltransferase